MSLTMTGTELIGGHFGFIDVSLKRGFHAIFSPLNTLTNLYNEKQATEMQAIAFTWCTRFARNVITKIPIKTLKSGT